MKVCTEKEIENWINSRPDGYLYYDFDNEEDIKIMVKTIVQNNNEEWEQNVEKIAVTIEKIGEFLDKQNTNNITAITKIINEMELVFKKRLYRQLFILSLDKLFE